MRSMQVNLRAMFADILGIASATESEANSLSALVNIATGRIQLSTSRISSIVTTVEQLSSAVTEIASATQHSADHAVKATSQVNHGVVQIEETLNASQRSISRMSTAQELIQELKDQVGSIQDLAEEIKDIADQTNLLALNAPIEAARAGESGRGFALVADEVRKLAERTSSSTVEISSTVERIGNSTVKTLAAMSSAAEEVEHSNHLMRQNQKNLNAIKLDADDIQSSAQHVATMLQQQKQATAELSDNFEGISIQTEQNSNSIETIRHATGQLESTARDLRQMAARFTNTL